VGPRPQRYHARMAEHISDSQAREIIHERNRAESKLEKIHEASVSMTAKATVIGAALATGFAIGAINAKEGATSEAPYSIGGTVPLDAAAAIGGTAAILLAKKPLSLALAAGIGGGALGCWGQRLGAAWEQAQMQAAGTATPTATATPAASSATSSGRVGFRGGMAGRLFGPGAYESDPGYVNPWMGAKNPYVQHYAGPAGLY